jgi:hypothetical protein
MKQNQLESLSLKQLERLIARPSPGSLNYELITPNLEAKRRRADVRRTWAIALVSATIALLAIVVEYLTRK